MTRFYQVAAASGIQARKFQRGFSHGLVRFLGDSLQQIRAFPESARKEAGVELHKVQRGIEPNDWKPITTIGPGVREIRIRDAAGAFRIIYLKKLGSAVYMLHAFQKKTQKTARRDLDLAASRLKQI